MTHRYVGRPLARNEVAVSRSKWEELGEVSILQCLRCGDCAEPHEQGLA